MQKKRNKGKERGREGAEPVSARPWEGRGSDNLADVYKMARLAEKGENRYT